MAGQSVLNFACLSSALIDYRFKFVSCSKVSNYVYFEFWLLQIFWTSDTSNKCNRCLKPKNDDKVGFLKIKMAI